MAKAYRAQPAETIRTVGEMAAVELRNDIPRKNRDRHRDGDRGRVGGNCQDTGLNRRMEGKSCFFDRAAKMSRENLESLPVIGQNTEGLR
ncbi:MAG TPA: hypothetical protein VFC07_15355, partial [Verrucomicrobiae bacterium]|nr:hypothetical protein [Verrucomicrobiae bacterium]